MQNFFAAFDRLGVGREAEGIARGIGQMISDGELVEGDQLPPVRSLAAHLGVSSATVAAAWKVLRQHGLIETGRRRGTTVRATGIVAQSRFWQVPNRSGQLRFDLSTGTPDPALLPRLEPLLASLGTDPEITSYVAPPVLPELEDLLRAHWPYQPAALTVVDGANDALDRCLASLVRLGDTVVVEDPTYPLLLDLLDLAGATVIGVGLDSEGPDLDQLAAALVHQPTALVLQTGAHNPTGIAMSAERAAAIADLLAGSSTIVIEDESASNLVRGDLVSIGQHLPDRVLRIHSFSKTYGPDLRLAALAGPSEILESIQRRRLLGPGWSSRLLQRLLFKMLTTPSVVDQVADAADTYAERRRRLGTALQENGIAVHIHHGLNLWVPVASEQLATIGLAAAGIGVSPGGPFHVADSTPHIRVTAAQAVEDYEALAGAIAGAAKASGHL